MRKKILAILLVMVMGFGVIGAAACSSDKKDEAKDTETKADAEVKPEPEKAEDDSKGPASEEEMPKIGFVVKSLADQYWVLVKAGAEAKAKELGIPAENLQFIAPNSESDVQGQVDMINNLVGGGIDVLCLAPSSDDAVQPALIKADEQGVKVIAVDTDTSFDKKISFIGTGNEAAGKLEGEFAGELVGEGKNAIILRGRLGDGTHDQREAGIKAGLESKGINILEVKAANSESETAMNAMQDLLRRFDNIDIVCTTADSMAQGAQRAIEAENKDIKVFGFDGTIPCLELVIEGKMAATTAQYPFKMGELGIENAVKIAKGETIDARIDSGAKVIGEKDAEAFLADLKSKVGE